MNHQASLPETRFKQPINGSWSLDRQRSRVEFQTRTLWGLMRVCGHFEDYEGRLDLAANPAIELTINSASLQSGNRKRDEHLRSADFFDSAHHPRVRFVSDSVAPEGPEGDTLRVRGRLFARDRSVPLEMTAHVRRADGELVLVTAVTAAHRELGMNWNWLGAISARTELRVSARLIPDS